MAGQSANTVEISANIISSAQPETGPLIHSNAVCGKETPQTIIQIKITHAPSTETAKLKKEIILITFNF